MGLERFGKVNFVGEAKVQDFIKFLEQGKIAGTRCKKCEKLYFPPRADCESCLSTEMEWVILDGKCRLLAYTNVHFAPPRLRYDCPYRLALAELQQGLKIFAPLSNDVEEEIEIGTELKVKVTELMGDRIIYELTKP